MSGFKANRVLLLQALHGAAEIGIEPCTMILEEHQFFLEARGELRVLGPFEAFEAAHGLVNASVQQENCFVEMRFLHSNPPLLCDGNVAVRQLIEVLDTRIARRSKVDRIGETRLAIELGRGFSDRLRRE